jgi:hypothetical protein
VANKIEKKKAQIAKLDLQERVKEVRDDGVAGVIDEGDDG